jgi:casein kinase II subunit alpha
LLANVGQKLKFTNHWTTDVKPDNILVNYSAGQGRFSEVELGDCVDVYCIPLEDGPNIDRPVTGAAMFRSPEATLSLPSGTQPTYGLWALQ